MGEGPLRSGSSRGMGGILGAIWLGTTNVPCMVLSWDAFDHVIVLVDWLCWVACCAWSCAWVRFSFVVCMRLLDYIS